MIEILSALKEYWMIFMGVVGAVIWLGRLESRSLGNEKEIRRLWTQRKEDLDNAQKSRDAQSKTLDELRDDTKEIRQDIKKLLSRPFTGDG
jgi:Tfp pilus assembly protein PilO